MFLEKHGIVKKIKYIVIKYLKLKNIDKTIGYSVTRGFLSELWKIELDKTKFGLHSLKLGRTTAAINFRVNDR